MQSCFTGPILLIWGTNIMFSAATSDPRGDKIAVYVSLLPVSDSPHGSCFAASVQFGWVLTRQRYCAPQHSTTGRAYIKLGSLLQEV